MKKIYILLAGFSASLTVYGQINHSISADPSSSTQPFPAELKPGLFYTHFYFPEVNAVFAATSHAKMYNVLRDTKFYSESWQFSQSHQDVLNDMDSAGYPLLKDWLTTKIEPYTDKVVVKFNSMPKWLSSSSNTVTLTDNWAVYHAHPPADYNKWDSIVRDVVSKISSWGIHPWYELWNEADGNYWLGTNADMLKLYKHTAMAIKQADPLAKVGGFGMHTWWQSLDPADKITQQAHRVEMYGFLPDSVPDRYSILYMLLDSVINNWAADSVPLDFISWHQFKLHPNEVPYIVDKFKNKMLALGYCPPGTSPCASGRYFPEHYVSEFQTTTAQEQIFQPGLFFKMQLKFKEAGIKMHSIAAMSDFHPSATNEFIADWGMMSQNYLIKPVFKEIHLLDNIISNGNMLPVQASNGIDALAGIKGDTLRIMLSNYVMPYVWYYSYYRVGWDSFEKLLYDTSSTYARFDYQALGYTSAYWGNPVWGNLDSIFAGVAQPLPGTPAPMLAQLAAARQQWINDSLWIHKNHIVTVNIPNNTGTLTAKYIVMDSTHNNIIYKYDSLRTAGYTHQRAVDSLQSCTFQGGCYGLFWTSDSITFSGTSFQLNLEANSIVYVLIDGVSLTPVSVHEQDAVTSKADVFPNPFYNIVSFHLPDNETCEKLVLRDLLGNALLEKENLPANFSMDGSLLAKGVYFYEITSQGKNIIGKVVKQ